MNCYRDFQAPFGVIPKASTYERGKLFSQFLFDGNNKRDLDTCEFFPANRHETGCLYAHTVRKAYHILEVIKS